MKYKNSTIFTVTVIGPDGKDYSFNMLGDSYEHMELCLKSAGIPATVDGTLEVMVTGIDVDDAQQVIDVLNAQHEADESVKQ